MVHLRARRNRLTGRSVLGLPLVATAVLAAACSGEDEEADLGPLTANGRSVILISIDSLRADHCTPHGYRAEFSDEPTTPFLQRMADEGVLFENAQSTTSWTLPAHISLVTGMDCLQHGVRNREHSLDPKTEHIAGRFQRAGYHTGGFYSAPFLAPIWGYMKGFDEYRAGSPYLLDAVGVSESITHDDPAALQHTHAQSHSDTECSERVMDEAIAWLAEDARHEEPFFLFLHLWDPHYDYQPPQEYADLFRDVENDGPSEFVGFMETRWGRKKVPGIRALYDAEIRYTDDQVARLFAQLEAWGQADEVVIAITSDHGDEFFEHGGKGHQRTLYQEVTHIPMVVRAPGLLEAGTRVPQSVSLYDLAPTLLELAEIERWDDRSGRSLVPLAREGGDSHPVLLDLHMHFAKGAHLSGVVEAQDKFLWDHDRDRGEVFDLASDPGEQKPTQLESPDGQAFARRAWAVLEQAREARPYAPMPELTQAMTEQLHQLGYTEGE